MSASLAALAAAAAMAAGAADRVASLPQRAAKRYRVEIAGEQAGWATLSIDCGERRCRVEWSSGLRAPLDAGGGISRRRIEMEVAVTGAALSVKSWRSDGRGERTAGAGAGPVPASLAEVLLSVAAPGERRCVTVREEESGRTGEACATREAEWLQGQVLGTPERFRARPGELPGEVVLPDQRVQFIEDRSAELPGRAPRLFGLAVQAGPGVLAQEGTGGAARPGRALRFCGRALDRMAELAADSRLASSAPVTIPPGLPLDFPDGANCREKTARWLARAQAAGFEARHAIGVAWDGAAYVWHEWAEVRVRAGWLVIDPSFRQAPAEGPRFTVARFADGDGEAEAEAGRQVLACWGVGRIETER